MPRVSPHSGFEYDNSSDFVPSAYRMLVRRERFPCEHYSEKDAFFEQEVVIEDLDSDSILLERNHAGQLQVKFDFQQALNGNVIDIIIKALNIEYDPAWGANDKIGYRVLVTTDSQKNICSWVLGLFKKHPDSDTQVCSGDFNGERKEPRARDLLHASRLQTV